MKRVLISFMVLLLVFTGCANKEKQVVKSGDNKHNIAVELEFNKKIYHGSFIKKYYPSFAIWIEDTESGKSETLYSTKKASTNKWIGADERPSSLPVWYGISKNDKESPVDGVTSATPSGKLASLKLPVSKEFQNKKVNIYIEANISFDYNDYYKEGLKEGEEGYSDVNGQPSLVWKATLDLDGKSKENISAEIVGHGHVLGADHKIYEDISKVTTAKQIFSQMKVSYSAQ